MHPRPHGWAPALESSSTRPPSSSSKPATKNSIARADDYAERSTTAAAATAGDVGPSKLPSTAAPAGSANGAASNADFCRSNSNDTVSSSVGSIANNNNYNAGESITGSGAASAKATKPSTYQTRDEALKVLKQRRRAKAAEAWKEKLEIKGQTKIGEGRRGMQNWEINGGITGNNGEAVVLKGGHDQAVGTDMAGDAANEGGHGRTGRQERQIQNEEGGQERDETFVKQSGNTISDEVHKAMTSLAALQQKSKYSTVSEKTKYEVVNAIARLAALTSKTKEGGEEGIQNQNSEESSSNNERSVVGIDDKNIIPSMSASKKRRRQPGDTEIVKPVNNGTKVNVTSAITSLEALQQKQNYSLVSDKTKHEVVNAMVTLTALTQRQNEMAEGVFCEDGVDAGTDDGGGRPDIEPDDGPGNTPVNGQISPLTAAMNFAAVRSDFMDSDDEQEDKPASPIAVFVDAAAGANAELRIGSSPKKSLVADVKRNDCYKNEQEITELMMLKRVHSSPNLETTSTSEKIFAADAETGDENENEQQNIHPPVLQRAQSNPIAKATSGAKKKKKHKSHSKIEGIENEQEIRETEMLRRSQSNSTPKTPSSPIKRRKHKRERSEKSKNEQEIMESKRQTRDTSTLDANLVASKKKKKLKRKTQQSSDERSSMTIPMTTLARVNSDATTIDDNDNSNRRRKPRQKCPTIDTAATPSKRLLASDDKRDGVTRILQSNFLNSKSARKKHQQNDSSPSNDLDNSGRSMRTSQNNVDHSVSSYKHADGDYVNSIVVHMQQPIIKKTGSAANCVVGNGEYNGSDINDNNTPLMDLWRKERRKKKKKKPKTTRLFLSRAQNQQPSPNADTSNNHGDNGIEDSTGRKNIRKRHQLFRHQLLLPKEFSSCFSGSSFPATAADVLDGDYDVGDYDCGREAGCPLPPHGRKRKRAATDAAKTSQKGSFIAQQEAHATHSSSLWDIWDTNDLSSDDDEEKVEIDVIGEDPDQQSEIQMRSLPYSDTLLWSQSLAVKRPIRSEPVGGGSGSGKITQIIHSLRERIERADALIQLKAPSYVEFQTKQWMKNNKSDITNALPVTTASVNENAALKAASNTTEAQNSADGTTALIEVAAPSQSALPDATSSASASASTPATSTSAARQINKTTAPCEKLHYQEQQTFFTLPPRSKSYSSSNSAQEFLVALRSAAKEATSATTDTNTPSSSSPSSPTLIVSKFLAIIKESRTNSSGQQSPFHLMKKVWALILSVVSRCDRGSMQGKELAQKFDAFLPEGYSMVSSNLLLLEVGLEQRNNYESNAGRDATALCPVNNHFVEGCVRTDQEFCGTLFR